MRRSFQAWILRFQHLQQTANHGQKLEYKRITTRGNILTFLDIWGFGSQNIFYTMWHLMWRPGYMIADYLNGRRSKYFNPFKTLVVTTLLVLELLWLLKLERPVWEPRTLWVQKYFYFLSDGNPFKYFLFSSAQLIDKYHIWMGEHWAMGLVVMSLLVAFITWIMFRSSPREEDNKYLGMRDQSSTYFSARNSHFNFAEICTAMIYIFCQLQIFSFIWLLLTRHVPMDNSDPFILPDLLMYIVFLADYKQLFGRSWWSTIWRTTLAVMWFM